MQHAADPVADDGNLRAPTTWPVERREEPPSCPTRGKTSPTPRLLSVRFVSSLLSFGQDQEQDCSGGGGGQFAVAGKQELLLRRRVLEHDVESQDYRVSLTACLSSNRHAEKPWPRLCYGAHPSSCSVKLFLTFLSALVPRNRTWLPAFACSTRVRCRA